MKIKIKQPLALNEIGKRKNQEDSIYPNLKSKGFASSEGFGNRLFIVCDGVGGLNKGEVASKLACEKFAENFNISSKSLLPNRKNILEAFEHTQNAFNKYIEQDSEAKGMATTLVSVHIHKYGLSITHCGDSRFYHIRNGKILWQTQDHSVINELIKAGVMTEEEAKNSKRNKISRAIQGNNVKKTKPDIHFINNLQKDDYLFLCSDGVSGSITDIELCEILSTEESNQENIQTINTLYEANSADNYSAYLVQIDKIENENLKIENENQKEKLTSGFLNNIKSRISNFIKI